MTDDLTRNRRRSVLLLAGVAVPVALVVTLLLLAVGLGVIAVVLGLAAGAGAAAAARQTATATVLRRSGARPADPEAQARLHNVVDGLCVAAGITPPNLFVIEDPAPNALVAGTSPQDAVLAVTTGLLDTLDRIELEGVLAHELSLVKQGDIVPATIAVATAGLLAKPLPGLHRRVMEAVLGERRPVLADSAAVELTRYPPGLISALEALTDAGTTVRTQAPALDHLWLAPPSSVAGPEALHPALDERIATLREL